MPIPVFISEVRASTTDTVQAAAGSVQVLPDQRYFLISSLGTTGSGRSLLSQLETSLGASSGATWTIGFTSTLKLRFTHNSGGSVNMILNRGLAWNLGCAKAFGSTYPPDLSLTITIPVPAGVSGYTAEFRSPWLWCPERPISSVGPEYFDPMIQIGIPRSPGTSVQAGDATAQHVRGGLLYDASFSFKGVEPLYRARPSAFNYGDANERQDYETWWRLGPSQGMRFLYWRDKSTLTVGTSTIVAEGTLAPKYVEYNTSAEMARAPLCKASAPPHLVFHDITVSGWITERGDATY